MSYEQVLATYIEKYNQATDVLEKEELHVVIKALSLQVPMKIEKIRSVYNPYKCPNCGCNVHYFDDFCTYCGHALSNNGVE